MQKLTLNSNCCAAQQPFMKCHFCCLYKYSKGSNEKNLKKVFLFQNTIFILKNINIIEWSINLCGEQITIQILLIFYQKEYNSLFVKIISDTEKKNHKELKLSAKAPEKV